MMTRPRAVRISSENGPPFGCWPFSQKGSAMQSLLGLLRLLIRPCRVYRPQPGTRGPMSRSRQLQAESPSWRFNHRDIRRCAGSLYGACFGEVERGRPQEEGESDAEAAGEGTADRGGKQKQRHGGLYDGRCLAGGPFTGKAGAGPKLDSPHASGYSASSSGIRGTPPQERAAYRQTPRPAA